MSKNVDELRAEALAKYDQRAVRLVDELNSFLKMLVIQREAIEKSLFEGLGYKGDKVDVKAVTASKELSLAYTRLVEAQIKLDKHLKAVADQMTPEEEAEAVRKYIYAMEPYERGRFLKTVIQTHNRRAGIVTNKIERDVAGVNLEDDNDQDENGA